MRVYETAGREADRELTTLLGKEGRLYRDDILLETVPKALRLSSSYEEWLAWWQEPAYVRPGFTVVEHQVLIPCFLTVVGRADEKAILDALQMPTQSDLNQGKLFFSSFHMLERVDPTAETSGFLAVFDKLDAGAVDDQLVERLLNTEIKPLSALTIERRRAFLTAALETMSLWVEMKPQDKAEWPRLLGQLIYGCERIVSAFAGSIYQDQVVKCAVTHRQNKPVQSLAVLRLLLMHHLAFDVVVVTGVQGVLEGHLPKEMFDYHLYQGIQRAGTGRKGFWVAALGTAAVLASVATGLVLLL